jgi:ABC-type taurine transport system substrate-binding protein
MMSDRKFDVLSERLDVLILMLDNVLTKSADVANVSPLLMCDFEVMVPKAQQRYQARLDAATAEATHANLLSRIYEIENDYPQLVKNR